MQRRRGLIGVVGLVLLVVCTATGCLRSELGVHVDGDGSGRVVVTVYFDDVSMQGSAVSVDDLVKLATTATRSVEGAEVSKVDSAGSEGVQLSIPFSDYNEVTRTLTSGVYQGYPIHLFQAFEIHKGDDDHWTMAASLDPAAFGTAIAQIPPGLASTAARVDPGTELVFEVSLPGDVLRSNADVVDGGTGTWTFKGDSGPQRFTMENEPSTLTPLQILLIAVGGLLLVGFILVLLTAAKGGKSGKWMRRRRRGGPDPVEQWQPKQPAAGSLGGRDASVLPVLSSTESSLPVLPSITSVQADGPRVAGVPVAPVVPEPVVPVAQDAPDPVVPVAQDAPDPVAQDAPDPVAQDAPDPVVPVAPEPVAQDAPVPEAPVAAGVADAVVPAAGVPAAPEPVVSDAAVFEAVLRQTAGDTAAQEPVAPAPVRYQVQLSPDPDQEIDTQPLHEGTESSASPVEHVEVPTDPGPAAQPAAPPSVPDQSHWLSPVPHEDTAGHWLDAPPDPDAERAADPEAWVAPPPRSEHWVWHEKPGDVEL